MLDFDDLVLRGKEVVLQPLCPDHASDLASASAEFRSAYIYNNVPDGEDNTRAYMEMPV
ncbi:MAG: hypothetical protein AB8B86_16090 [Pseudomonadales bacterium]